MKLANRVILIKFVVAETGVLAPMPFDEHVSGNMGFWMTPSFAARELAVRA